MHALTVVPYLNVNGHTLFDRVLAVNDVAHRLAQVTLFRFCEEPNVAQVHTNQGDTGVTHHLGGTQNRAIATQHHA